jgi:hypothetical protein
MATYGYTKLAASIVTSSVWVEDYPTRLVWIAMLALANKEGVVEGSVPGFARIAGVTRTEMEAALEKFLAPDPDSRDQEFEGRRIEVWDKPAHGGWRLLNYAKYRDDRDSEERREYKRRWQAEYRRKKQAERETAKEKREREGAEAAQDLIRERERRGEG